MNHLDLFSGYGGFTIPASKYGIKTIYFSEIDKYANSVLKYRFPNIPNLGDVTKINAKDLQPIDIITGGSPCQDLSVAGKGAGLNGARSGLFYHFIRLIREIQPLYFIWENVKGAFSSQRGWDFARVQIEMESSGYDVWWQLLNAKDFGVPQNRERIFAIGIRKGSGREILFEPSESRQNPKQIVEGSQGSRVYNTDCAAGDQMNMVAVDLCTQGPATFTENVRTIKARYNAGITNRKGDNSGVIVHNLQTRSPNRPSLLKNKNAGGSGHLQREDGVTYTVDTGGTQGVDLGDMRIRRLTPTECERLMGLEDGEKCGIIRLWQKEVKNSPTNKTSANVEKLNGKVVRPVGSVGKTESQENVLSARESSLLKNQVTKKPVVLNVQVNSEKNSIKIWQGDNKKDLLLNVNGVEKRRKFPNQNQIADFVQMVVGLNTILWRETHNGKVESQVREQPLILQKNGVPVLNMYGRNTMPHARDVEKDLITLNQHLKSIISLDLRIKNYGQDIQTLFYSVIPVITGFTPTKIKTESISEVKLSVLSGWTAKGIIDGKEVDISDTQRYKMCGNGVVVNCVDYIYNLISKTL